MRHMRIITRVVSSGGREENHVNPRKQSAWWVVSASASTASLGLVFYPERGQPLAGPLGVIPFFGLHFRLRNRELDGDPVAPVRGAPPASSATHARQSILFRHEALKF